MSHHRITSLSVLAAICALPLGCSAGAEGTESRDSASQAISPGQCNQAVAKDVLIAELVKNSTTSGYPLTRLSTDANGSIVGPNLTDEVAGILDTINTVPDARDSVARALSDVAGLADYVPAGIGPDSDACTGIPAWTPNGTTTVNTTSNEVFVGDTNHDSWVAVQKAFGKECPLIKRLGNKDVIDPPCDGSSGLAAGSYYDSNTQTSYTVSASGVTANAFGICPAGTSPGTYCKQYNATQLNYTGRSCQLYYGVLKCLLY